MQSGGIVIAVGLDQARPAKAVADSLRERGYSLIGAPTLPDLPRVLEQAPGAPILAYKGPGVEIRLLLATARDAATRSPVIVLVDHSEWQEYYELMCAGAYDYFGVSDRPEWIQHAVNCAGQAQLEPPPRPNGNVESIERPRPPSCRAEELVRQRLADAVAAKICRMCPDRNVDGSCNRRREGSCTLFAKLPEATAAILEVWSERMELYIQAIRDHVCAQCQQRNPGGPCDLRDTDQCMLNSYLPLVVETVEEQAGRQGPL